MGQALGPATVDDIFRIRKLIGEYVQHMMVRSLAGKYPLVSVFFPEIGIDYNAERPMDIAAKAIELTAAST